MLKPMSFQQIRKPCKCIHSNNSFPSCGAHWGLWFSRDLIKFLFASLFSFTLCRSKRRFCGVSFSAPLCLFAVSHWCSIYFNNILSCPSCFLFDFFSSFARRPYGWVFFAEFVTWAYILIFWSKLLETENRYGNHIFAISGAKGLSPKKSFQKNRLHGFLRSFEKKRNFWLFPIFDLIYLRTETEWRVHGYVNCTRNLYATF